MGHDKKDHDGKGRGEKGRDEKGHDKKGQDENGGNGSFTAKTGCNLIFGFRLRTEVIRHAFVLESSTL